MIIRVARRDNQIDHRNLEFRRLGMVGEICYITYWLGGQWEPSAMSVHHPKTDGAGCLLRRMSVLIGICLPIAVLSPLPPAVAQVKLKQADKPVLKRKPVTIGKRQDNRLGIKPPPAGVVIGSRGTNRLGGGGGELQSTVVPPGKKSACPKGRLLISDDTAKNPGKVYTFDLGAPDNPPSGVTPEALPDLNNQRVLSNDHDLVSLANGDVLLIKMGQSKGRLKPKPAWFDHTYKLTGCDADTGQCSGAWGPGARSVIFVWRSEDCGNSFSLRSSIDTAKVNDGWGTRSDGSGGLPQKLRGFANGLTTSPGSSQQPAWQMGGTDGPFAKVDHASGRVFYSLKIAGRKPDKTAPNFSLSNARLGRSVVMMSEDRGDTWQEATTLPYSNWRIPVAPQGNNRLAFVHGRDRSKCTAANNYRCYIHYQIDIGSNLDPSSATDEGEVRLFSAPADWSEGGVGKKESDRTLIVKGKTTNINANIYRHKLLTRNPDAKGSLMVFTQEISGGRGFGYGMYSIVPEGFYTGMPQIAPALQNPASFILHPTAIDIGSGPILFYWYDVNGNNGKMQVRGRLVTGARDYTVDFSISGPFDTPGSPMWFGDYHTAGGFQRPPRLKIRRSGGSRLTRKGADAPRSYDYFPVWKQSDGNIHFARVSYTEPDQSAANGHNRLKGKAVAIPEFQPLDFSKISVRRLEYD